LHVVFSTSINQSECGGWTMAAMDLQEQVLRELKFDPSIDESRIGVTASSGVVTLTGTVSSYLQKLHAESAAKRVRAVKAVANDIQVVLAGATKRTDTDIAQRAVDTLRWHSGIPAERITVTVSDGWVTLEGDVDFHFQKQEAERDVNTLTGVLGVANRIRVIPLTEPKPDVVEREIRDALVRRARLEARNIDVRTEGSRVILEGEVDNWDEADEVEMAAWQAPGVSAVQNNLRVASYI
jgi:osmotically-inducible protein OsmY